MFDDQIKEWMHEYLMTKTKEQLIEIMVHAIDIMQGYNGHTHMFCMATAAGFTRLDEGKWKYPEGYKPCRKESSKPKQVDLPKNTTAPSPVALPSVQPFKYNDLSGRSVASKPTRLPLG